MKIDTQINGRLYTVVCDDEELSTVTEALSYLNKKMSEISQKTKTRGERLAVLAAVNLAHESLIERRDAAKLDISSMITKIQILGERIDKTLTQQQALF